MKKIIILLLMALSAVTVDAQFKSATLLATGLTCAMCSKAIYNSLQELPFIQSIEPSIKNSAFDVVFRPGVNVDIDALKKAVEDAGFSVGKLKLVGSFNKLSIKNNEHVQINNKTFHFLSVNDQVLNGDRQITIVDKNYLSPKEFKKFSSSSHMECVHTGRASGCCKKEGITQNTRIYHATM